MLSEKSASSIKEMFLGAWTLERFEFRRSDGTVSDVMGKQASGLVIYDASGHVSAQVMRTDRTRFVSGDQFKGTDEEVRMAFEGYLAYFGEYEIDEQAGAIIHHTQGAMFPNLVGQDQKRFYEFSGNHLTLTTPPIVAGGVTITGILIWVKAS